MVTPTLGSRVAVSPVSPVSSTPDTACSFLYWNGDLRFFVACQRSGYLWRGSRASLVWYSNTARVGPTLIDGQPEENYAAWGTVFKNPNNPAELLAFVHGENHCSATIWWWFNASINLHSSLDGGITWTNLGQVIAGRNESHRCVTEGRPSGAGEMCAVFSPDNQYLYIYYTDWAPQGPDEVHLARVAVGQVKDINAYRKWNNGAWSNQVANVAGTASTSVVKRDLNAGQTYVAHISASWNRALGRYVAVGEANSAIWWAESTDGITWTTPVNILTSSGDIYPSLLDFTQESSMYTGATAELLTGVGSPHLMYTRPVTITTAPPAPTSAPFVVDPFSDSNGVALSIHNPTTGGPWLKTFGPAGIEAAIWNNRLFPNTLANQDIFYIATGKAPSPDHGIRVIMDALTASPTDQQYFWHFRADDALANGYALAYNSNTQTLSLLRRQNNAYTATLGSATAGFGAGSSATFEAKVVGSTFTVSINNVVQFTANDTAITTGNRVGWNHYGGGATTTTGLQMTSFEAFPPTVAVTRDIPTVAAISVSSTEVNFWYDTFTGSNGDNVVTGHTGETGASYSKLTGPVGQDGKIQSNRFYSDVTTSTDLVLLASGVQPGNDARLRIKFDALTAPIVNQEIIVYGRGDASMLNAYGIRYRSSTGDFRIVKRVSGTNTGLGTAYSFAWSAGQSALVELVISGSTLTLFIDGVQRDQVTGETSITTGTRVGIHHFGANQGSALNATSGLHIDYVQGYTGAVNVTRDIPTVAAISFSAPAPTTVTRDITTTAAISFSGPVSRDIDSVAAVSLQGEAAISTVAAISRTALNFEPPPFVPVTPAPILRLYESAYLRGSAEVRAPATVDTRGQVPEQTVYYSSTGASPSAAISYTVVEPGDYLAVGVASPDGRLPAAPAGWTQYGAVGAGGTNATAIYVKPGASSDIGAAHTFTASGSGSFVAYKWRLRNVASVSPVDQSVGSNTNATPAGAAYTTISGTTPALTFSPDMVLAVGAGSGAADVSVELAGDGLISDGSGYNGSAAFRFAHRLESSAGAKSLAFRVQPRTAATVASKAGVLSAIAIKSSGSTVRFAPVGEFDSASGQATARPYELGEFTLDIPKADPLTARIAKNAIIEWYIPAAYGFAGHSFEFYLVQDIVDHDDEPEPYVSIRGFDLRVMIADLALQQAQVLSLGRSSPAGMSIENWARAYISATAIAPSNTDYTAVDKIAGLALEAVSGNRGTVYPSPPASAGAPLFETLVPFLRADNIGFRIALKNAGTTAGALEVQFYSGVDRRLGVPGEAVFAAKFDTARRVVPHVSGIGARNALTLIGPAVLSVRPTYYAEDAASKQEWGMMWGMLDGQNIDNASVAVAVALLRERLPRAWVEVDGQDAPWLRLFQHYDRLDLVSALARDGRRFDGQITAITLYHTGATGVGSAGWATPEFFGLEPPPDAAPSVANLPPPFLITIGDAPTDLVKPVSKEAAALAPYTHIDGLTTGAQKINVLRDFTGDAVDLQRVADVEPGITSGQKAIVPDAARAVDYLRVADLRSGAGAKAIDDGATRNDPTTSAATVKGTPASAPSVVSNATAGTGTAAGADTASVNTALTTLTNALNALQAKHDALVDSLKRSGGSGVLND